MRAPLSGMVNKILNDPETGKQFADAVRKNVRTQASSEISLLDGRRFAVKIVGIPVKKSSK